MCYYNMVSFLQNPQKRHPIACLLRCGMGCLLYMQTLIYIPYHSLQPCMQHHAILNCVIRALNCSEEFCMPLSPSPSIFEVKSSHRIGLLTPQSSDDLQWCQWYWIQLYTSLGASTKRIKFKYKPRNNDLWIPLISTFTYVSARSPIISHVNATLQGLHTIRAFGVEPIFIQEYHRHQDLQTSAWFLSCSLTRWFCIRLDTVCGLFITAVAFCSIWASDSKKHLVIPSFIMMIALTIKIVIIKSPRYNGVTLCFCTNLFVATGSAGAATAICHRHFFGW